MKKLLFITLSLVAFAASAWTIKGPATPTPVEKTALQELKKYLTQSVQSITIDGKEVTFYVGSCPSGVAAPKLASEEWKIFHSNNDVILIGGGSRGTLYAVYRFLEDVVKIRFWTQTVETVPKHENLKLGDINLTGKPYFLMRDIYRSISLANDDGLWNYRNRLNRNGDTPVGANLGGSFTYGRPYHVHTFEFYINSGELLVSKPEYFSLVNGRRVGGQTAGQICLTNPEVKAMVIQKLHEYIKQDRIVAKNAGLDYPKMYDISQNDNRLFCQCKNCQKAVSNGNQSDLLISFINDVADSIKDEYPDVLVETLAYLYTEEPPVNTVPRDNVIIRFCDTTTNPALSTNSPENKDFVRKLKAWSKLAKTLSIWDYSVIFVRPGMPLPHEYTLVDTVNTYKKNKVKMLFWEHEFPDCADMWELTNYLEAKISEDPSCNLDKWKSEFLTNYYGAAAPYIKKYRDLLNQVTQKVRPKLGWFAAPMMFNQLNVENLKKFEEILFQAVEAVKNDPVLLQRVERARLSVDRAVIIRYGILINEHLNNGGTNANFPFDRPNIISRIERVWTKSINETLNSAAQAEALKKMRIELDGYKQIPTVKSRPPKKFGIYNQAKVYDFPSYEFSLFETFLRMVPDPEAETGCAVQIDADKTAMPMYSGLYAPEYPKDLGSLVLQTSQITGPGYQWYKVGKSSLYHISVLYTLGWLAQMPLDRLTALVNQPENSTKYEAWIRIKFTGINYPYGKPNEPNAIWVDRAILIGE